MIFEIGRLAVKIAGRDSGKKCVVVDVLDSATVLIDGETRRRKCNIKHLEPLADSLGIKKNVSHDIIKTEFKKLGIDIKETKPKQAKPKQKQVRAADRKKMAPKEEKKTKPKGKVSSASKPKEKEGTELENTLNNS